MRGLRLRLRAFLSHLGANKAVIGAGRLTLATVLGQTIVLLAAPILTRTFEPLDFGVLALFTSIISIVSVFATMRFHLAIPVLAYTPSAISLAVGSIILTLIVGMLTGLLAFFVSRFYPSAVSGIDSIHPAYFTFGVVSVGVFQVVSHWAVRDRNYHGLAGAKIAQAGSTALSQVFFGSLTLGPFGLLIGQVLGQSVGTIRLAKAALRNHGEALRQVTTAKIIQAMSLNRNYAFYSTPAALLTNANLNLPPILLTATYGPELVGLYALGARLIKAPLQMVGNSVSQVYLAELGKRLAGERVSLSPIFRTTVLSLGAIGIPPLLLLAYFAPSAFEVVFGSEWRGAGEYTRLLVPMYIAQFVVSPISQTLNALQKQRTLTLITLAQSLLLLALFATPLLIPFSIELLLSLYSSSMVAAYLAMGFLTHRAVRRVDGRMLSLDQAPSRR